jgi:predicted nucleic acid-binding protein
MSAPTPTSAPPTPIPLVVLDASVWISSVLPQDSNHALANNWLQTYISNRGQLIAPMILVVETAAALSRLTGDPIVAHNGIAHLHSFTPMSLVPLEQSLVDETADTAADLGLRAGDAMYVALAKRLGLPLVTFDREQLAKAAGVISTVRP